MMMMMKMSSGCFELNNWVFLGSRPLMLTMQEKVLEPFLLLPTMGIR
uniref:Uncharacterized protein n=1 Tax=Rhizophora mucronata TaxID=61149 RepID=A0A2P2Q3W9_RHIMU